MSTYNLEARPHFAVSIQMCHPAILRIRKREIDSHQHAGQAHLGQIAGAGQFQHDDLVDFRVPMLLRPTTKIAPTNESSLVVVRAVVGGSRMRNIDGDHRNTSFTVLGGNDGRDSLVSLELNCQVDLFANQKICVALGDLGAIAIV